MVYEGSGPEERERAESFAVLASWASRHGNESAGLEESGGRSGPSSRDSASADCPARRALLWKGLGPEGAEHGLEDRRGV